MQECLPSYQQWQLPFHAKHIANVDVHAMVRLAVQALASSSIVLGITKPPTLAHCWCHWHGLLLILRPPALLISCPVPGT